MRTFLVLILFSKLAFAADHTCWQHEINARTQQTYTTEADYDHDYDNWMRRSSLVNPFQLIKAYKVYKSEKGNSLALESDKMGHCYMGCRIRQRTDLRTVRYVAWIKEVQDITDCDPNTHFEEADFNATVLGGSLQAPDAAACVAKCREELPKIGLR